MKKNYLLPINIGITIFYLLFSTSCQKQAETEQERQEMIVGTWGTTVKQGTLTADKSFYWEITFTEDGRCLSEIPNSDYHKITLEDSVWYEVKGDELVFVRLKNKYIPIPKGIGEFIVEPITITKLTANDFDVKDKYDEYCFDKK